MVPLLSKGRVPTLLLWSMFPFRMIPHSVFGSSVFDSRSLVFDSSQLGFWFVVFDSGAGFWFVVVGFWFVVFDSHLYPGRKSANQKPALKSKTRAANQKPADGPNQKPRIKNQPHIKNRLIKQKQPAKSERFLVFCLARLAINDFFQIWLACWGCYLFTCVACRDSQGWAVSKFPTVVSWPSFASQASLTSPSGDLKELGFFAGLHGFWAASWSQVGIKIDPKLITGGIEQIDWNKRHIANLFERPGLGKGKKHRKR